ncbi:MAG: Uncharacterised protein [Flavobacteriia bacterium]|nr:MAG: Uncharacterised protein [Flavobacteriia bacterium]
MVSSPMLLEKISLMMAFFRCGLMTGLSIIFLSSLLSER